MWFWGYKYLSTASSQFYGGTRAVSGSVWLPGSLELLESVLWINRQRQWYEGVIAWIASMGNQYYVQISSVWVFVINSFSSRLAV
jgi:hypothetical protein